MEEKPISINIIKKNSIYLLVASILLIIGLVVGIAFPVPEDPVSDNPILDQLQPLFEFYKPYSPTTVIFLFLKNSLTATLSFFLGPIFLIVPSVILLFNGFLIGMVGSAVSTQISIWVALASLAPHGIFEIPALVLASAAGLRFGIAAMKKLKSTLNQTKYSLSVEFNRSFQLFLFAAILLLIAAIIETYITPLFLGITP